MRCFWIPAALALAFFGAGCAGTKKAADGSDSGSSSEDAAALGGAGGVPSFLMPRRGDDGGTPIKAGGNVRPIPAGAMLADDEIVWTNADDATVDIPELDGLMKEAGKTDGPWLQSEGAAKRRSKQTGKPMLIWFTDKENPYSKNLNSDLFSRDDFETWAKENVVRLMVDQSVQGTSMRDTDAKQIYVRELKQRYKVMGHPTVLVLSSSGEVIGRYRGYVKGRADFMWGQIKQGVHVATENSKKFREALEKKGYRDWSDGSGRTIFAKLSSYQDGVLVLAEPDGQRARTKETHLSAADQEWIRQEKEKRGIR